MRVVREMASSEDEPIGIPVPGPIYAIYHLAPSLTPSAEFLTIEIIAQGAITVFVRPARDSVVLPLATGPDGNPVALFPRGATVYAYNPNYSELATGPAAPRHTLIVVTD